MTGLRHVPEEEDQVRRQDAQVFALHQLQDGLCLYTGRKEAESPQRVGLPFDVYSSRRTQP